MSFFSFCQHGGPRLHRNNRELQSPPERWAPSDCNRSFAGRMVNNRAGPWKRPAHHQRREQLHHNSPPPQHPLARRGECPAKRRRDSGPDQVNLFNFPQTDLISFKNNLFVYVIFHSCTTAPSSGKLFENMYMFLCLAISPRIKTFIFTHPCPITTTSPPVQP